MFWTLKKKKFNLKLTMIFWKNKMTHSFVWNTAN